MKKAIFLVLLYFVCQFVGTLPFILLHFLQGDPNPLQLTDASELGLSVLVADVLMVAHLLFWKEVRFTFRSLAEVPVRVLLLCLPLVLSAMFVLNVLVEWLQLPNWGEDAFVSMSRNVWGVLGIVAGAPVLEELLFRGAVMDTLRQRGYSPLATLLLSSVIFGVFHLNPAQIPFACLLGLLLGWLYQRTGSLVPGMFCHFVNNTLGVLSMQQADADAQISHWAGGTAPLLLGLLLAVAVFAGTFAYAYRHLQRVPKDTGTASPRE